MAPTGPAVQGQQNVVRHPAADDENENKDGHSGGPRLLSVEEERRVGNAVAQIVDDLTGSGAQRRGARWQRCRIGAAAQLTRSRRHHLRDLGQRVGRSVAETMDDQLAGAVRQTGAPRPLAVAVGCAVDAQVHPAEQRQRHDVAQDRAGHEQHRPHFLRVALQPRLDGRLISRRWCDRRGRRRHVELVVVTGGRRPGQGEQLIASVRTAFPEMFASRIWQAEGGHGHGQDPLSGEQQTRFGLGHSAVVMEWRHDGAILVDSDDQSGANRAGRNQGRNGLSSHTDGVVDSRMRVR